MPRAAQTRVDSREKFEREGLEDESAVEMTTEVTRTVQTRVGSSETFEQEELENESVVEMTRTVTWKLHLKPEAEVGWREKLEK
eukprot:2584574-Rhodomonas_salina.1